MPTLVNIFRLACLFALLSAPVTAQTLTIGGTGSALEVMRQLGTRFTKDHAGVTVRVLPSLGSGGGIKALIGGEIDLAVSARDLKSKEQGQPIRATYYGRTPIAFASHRDTGLSDISSQEVLAIYQGQQSRWPDGTPVRLVLRPDSETDFRRIADQIPVLADVYEVARGIPGVPIAYNDAENVELLQSIPGSFGTVTLSQFLAEQPKLNILAFDGTEPSAENLQNGSYRVWKDYWLVTPAEPSALVAAFVEMVRSPSGQELLRQLGHDLATGPQ